MGAYSKIDIGRGRTLLRGTLISKLAGQRKSFNTK